MRTLSVSPQWGHGTGSLGWKAWSQYLQAMNLSLYSFRTRRLRWQLGHGTWVYWLTGIPGAGERRSGGLDGHASSL